eukprot:TRINITY_DN29479_c0_g1_i1.p1 TRINITY_DN29479_c0_g1~~TRINITY_DN29479_c0_g1_i1.p1  ORF type:complete len:330 (-),score=36.41 TRINITY_DN29479_c0_g1_i1:364-1353(-)
MHDRMTFELNTRVRGRLIYSQHQQFQKRNFQRKSIRNRGFLQIQNSWQEVLGVVGLSAIPFAVVQGLADSEYGKSLAENVQRKLPELKKQTQQMQQQRKIAQKESKWYGEGRPKWLGPITYNYPEHLRGELPGDYGFDILNLGQDPEKLEKYYEYELLHARWAMLAALGALLPEVLQYNGVTQFLEPVWWNVGYAKLSTGEDLNYLGLTGVRVAGSQGVAIIAFCQVILMFGPEYARYCGIDALVPVGVFLPGDKNYPGGKLFDPLGLSENPAAFEELRIKEIKNGRLAMVAWLGLATQAVITQKGPIQNIIDFWKDPVHNNVVSMLMQ